MIRTLPSEFISGYSVEAFIEKLVLLEQKTGANVHYRIMPPIATSLHDPIAIQAAAKKIAEFIGMGGFTFVIATAKQKNKVGGHIDLSTGGREVFVEVDADMMRFPNAVAATLCHETCHKWLQIHGINLPVEYDNEILTDITAVFLGFGKIMLNGCSNSEVSIRTIKNETETKTETMEVGYLKRDQLAFVYRLVCEMRNIPSSDFLKNLNPEAADALQRCHQLHGQYFALTFRGKDSTHVSIAGFESRIIKLQSSMADLDKHVTYIEKCFCETVDGFLSTAHKQLISYRQKAIVMRESNEPDPALSFLRAIQEDIEVKRLNAKIDTISREAGDLLQHAKSFGRNLSQNGQRFPTPSPEVFSIVTCPQDGTKLRLPENSGEIIATCPTCKYRFVYNTNAPTFSEVSAPDRPTWWQKIRMLTGRVNR